VYIDLGLVWYLSPGRCTLGWGGGCGCRWEGFELGEDWQRVSVGYDANDLNLKLEGISLGVCEHGSCLVPVSWEEWSPVG